MLVVTFVVGACEPKEIIFPSSNVTQQERAVQSYNGILIEATIEAEIEYSDTEENIVIEANENLHSFIEVDYINNKLRIRLKNNVNIRNKAVLKAYITTKNPITEFSASGASSITTIGSNIASNVHLNISGASKFKGTISTPSLKVRMSGASNANLQGEARSLNCIMSGASLFGSYDLLVDEAKMNLSGASMANLSIHGTIDLTATGASSLIYKGDGKQGYIDLSDGSSIIKY